MYLPMRLYKGNKAIDTNFFHIGGKYYIRPDGAFTIIENNNDLTLECCTLNGDLKCWSINDFVKSEMTDYTESERCIALFGLFMPVFVKNVDLSTLSFEDGYRDSTITKILSAILYFLKSSEFWFSDNWLYMKGRRGIVLKVFFTGDEQRFIGDIVKYKVLS